MTHQLNIRGHAANAPGWSKLALSITVILILALAVRLVGVVARPAWYDEAFAVLFAQKGPAAMLVGTLGVGSQPAADIHPILYYTLLWGWMGIWGSSILAVRLLSVLFGIGAVCLAAGLVKDLFGKEHLPGLVFWLALAPFQVHYAQEVRMYAQLGFFLLGATWALWRGFQGGSWRAWAAFAVCAVLAQYTHSLAVVYLLPLALTPVLAHRWAVVRKTIISGLAALLLYLPWLLQIPSQLGKIQAGYWTSRPGPERLLTALLSYVTNLPLPGLTLPLGLFVTLLVTVLAAWQTLRVLRQRQPGARRGALLAYLGLAPLALLYGVSLVQPVFIERALLPAGVLFLLWVAWALRLTGLPGFVRWASQVLLLAGMLAGLVVHITYSGFPYAPYPALVADLRARLAPAEVVVHSNKLSMLPAVYYAPDLPQRYIADPAGSGSDTLAPATQQVLGLVADPDLEQAVGEASGVYLVIFKQAIAEYQAQGAETHPHLVSLGAEFQLAEQQSWGDLEVYVFRR